MNVETLDVFEEGAGLELGEGKTEEVFHVETQLVTGSVGCHIWDVQQQIRSRWLHFTICW